MKKMASIMFAFLLWAGHAAASEAQTPRLRVTPVTVTYSVEIRSNMEEVVVTAPDLSKFDSTGLIRSGLSETVLVHVYEPLSDTWKYVGTQLRHKDSK